MGSTGRPTQVLAAEVALRVALVNPPYLAASEVGAKWVTVPPQGYGGIQWMVANLTKGLLQLGCDVAVLGAPGSPRLGQGHVVVDAASHEEIDSWLSEAAYDLIHDHSNGQAFRERWAAGRFVSTHHLTGAPALKVNPVYLSRAQRAQAGSPNAPIIRLPADLDRHYFRSTKKDYLLYLGRVSPWKGVQEAAQFARAVGLPLWVAGPVWEPEYLKSIRSQYGDAVLLIGEVGGHRRLELIASARALLAMSQPVPGPWGGVWCEPGASVVAEAAASGTPVISSDNGCLAEICPLVGAVVPVGHHPSPNEAREIIDSLPDSFTVRSVAEGRWACDQIAAQYVEIYRSVLRGNRWT